MKQAEANNPHLNPQIGLSNCCNAPVRKQPMFSEPPFIYCSHCHTQCVIVWKPVFEKVSAGCFRTITYNINAPQ